MSRVDQDQITQNVAKHDVVWKGIPIYQMIYLSTSKLKTAIYNKLHVGQS